MSEMEAGVTDRDSLSATQVEVLDRACDRFAAAMRAGDSARIEDHLGEAEGPVRSALLNELIALDIDWRQRRGKRPEQADYRDRFPGHAGAVAAAFARADAGPSVSEARRFPFKQVVSLCEDFTDDWKPQERPNIPSYLLRAADDIKETLLFNLLQNEIQRRRLVGESPRADEYIEQLPGYSSLVRKVFLESTSLGSGLLDGAHASAAESSPLVANRLGDYRLVRELGRGGMGVVFEAVHVNRGNRLALKMLPRVDGAQLYRFKREFRSAADISHPNLIGLYSLESDGGQWFFTMDLVEGVDFLNFVRPGCRLDEPRLRSAFAQLAMGVMALHRHRIIHRDLKPSNVMVSDDGHVILLDFGLVVELEQPGMTQSTDKIAGTPAYMAPEQAAGIPVTPACDWYAVGVMLYEALSGTRPYSGTIWEIIQAKQTVEPPPLPQDRSVPDDLATLCLKLLARDPRQRPDAFEIAKKTASSLQPGPVSVTSTGGPHLVGRESHLGVLKDAFRTLRREGAPQIVFISGRSGEGKTALGEHFLASLRQDKNLAVMAGRCYDRESVPFKGLDSLIDSLASYLKALPETDAALLVPDDIEMLAHVFPVFQRVEVVARAGGSEQIATIDEQQVRQRAFAALRSLLSRMSRRSPVVWFIDDLQWGDGDSALALFEVLKPPKAPQVLFVGTYRSDEAEASAFLKTWKELKRKHDVGFVEAEVKVGPLAPEECTALVIDLLGQDNEVVRRRALEFVRETGGNPFLLIELVGCFDPETDSFEPMPLHEVLARKLGRLPDEAGQLLDVVAISGQALALDEASRTAGHQLLPVATLTRMRNERLVRLIGSEDKPLVDTYHDRVRETVLSRMDEKRCSALHLALAEVIENDSGCLLAGFEAALEQCEEKSAEKAIPRVYDLAYHFDAAGQRRKAWIYALLAAEQARRQSALEVATQQYARAERNAEGTADAVRFRIAEGCGEALMLLGRYDDATRELEGTMDLVDDPERKARIELLQGEITFKQGSMDRSVRLYEYGLRRLGERVPQSWFGLLSAILRGAATQCVHSLRPGSLHKQRASSRLDLVVRLYGRAVHPAGFQNTLRVLWTHLYGMNRAELLPPSRNLAFSYANHGMMISMLGWQSRGSRYADRATALASSLDDTLLSGFSANCKGIGLYASARYEAGQESLSEAIDAYEKAGDLWELHLAHFHRGCCQFGLGNLADAIAEARWVFASSARLGDSRTLCSSWLWARATRGDFPFEELKSCYPNRPDDVLSTLHGVLAEGYWHAFHGRTTEALAAFERAALMVRKTFCVNSHTVLVMPMLAMGLRLHADAIQASDPKKAESMRRRACRVARWGTRLTRFFPAAYPVALRERSLILAACGKTKQALKFADKSCAVALTQKARYEHAQSLRVRG
jgi:serine/threonine protein kinase/tetratricopeptide (TPR) repeat protein